MNLLFVDGLLLPPIQTVMTWGWFIWFYYIKIHYHPLPSTKTHCGKALFPTGRSHRVGVWVPHSAGHCARWSCRCSCQAKHRPRPGSFGSSGLRRIFWNTLTCFFGISLEALEISWDILSCYILLVLAFFWVENMTNLLSTLCASPFLWAWVVCTYESNSCPEVPGAFGTEDTGGASAAQDGNGLECSIDSRMRNYAIWCKMM